MPRSTGGGGDANAGEDGARTGGDGGGAAAATAEAQHLALELNRSIDGSQEQPSFVEPGRRSAGSEEVSLLPRAGRFEGAGGARKERGSEAGVGGLRGTRR